MVRISDNSTRNIRVRTNTESNVNVNSATDSNIQANMNGNSQRAKSWAVGEGLIDGVDYSAKYYANKAQQDVEAAIANLKDSITGIGNIEVDKTLGVVIKSTTYVHEQGIASDTWEIEHNLNKYPSVTLVDSAGTQFQGRVEYTDENNCIVYMNGATKGKAYLN